MLKLVRFEGELMVDTDQKNMHRFVRDFIDDCDIKTTYLPIKKVSDIPMKWRNGLPYGDRKDNKTCLQIFTEEILPENPLDDPNQVKFPFVNEIDKTKMQNKS